MCEKNKPLTGEEKTISWWWLGLVVGIVTALILWWWLEQKNKKFGQSASRKNGLSSDQAILLPDEDLARPEKAPKTQQVSAKPDDFRIIEGIGPKIQAAFQAAGILSYAQLAAAQPAELKQMLVEAGIRLGDPATWPEQAALAAAGNWEQLNALQSTLKGGRLA